MSQVKPLALVLEDNASAGEALALVLRDWGADVALLPSADAIVETLGDRAAQARWIITDYDLGAAMNGVTIAKLIRADAPNIPVLVLSGSVGSAAEQDAANAGFAFMRKPAPAEAILAWLEQA